MKNKFLNTLSSFSLGKRLTIYFIIFGLLIGYLIFIMTTAVTAKNTVSYITSSIFDSQFEKLISKENNDVCIKLLNNNNKELVDKAKTIFNIPKMIKDITLLRIYYYNTLDQKWNEIYLDEATGNFNIKNIPQERLKFIKKMTKHKNPENIYKNIFLGKSDIKTTLVNITRENDNNLYYLAIDYERKGLIKFIKHNIKQFIIFDLVLFLLSVFLGKFFAMRIAKPISKISSGASEIASGKYDYRLNIKRRDEIGILSSSIDAMASKVESNINEITRHLATMETMNQIDKAVLSSISRNDLMSRVVGIVSSLFKNVNIEILLRNDEKKGFDVMALTEKIKSGLLIDKPCICDAEIGHKNSCKMKDKFQLIKSSKNKKIFDFIENTLGTEVGTFLNIPMYMNDNYIGSLVMTKTEKKEFKEYNIARAGMLADQVCIALQSVQMFEEKESILFGILLALTKSIDAKSKWTAGHSERVAKYAEFLGIKMNLNEEQIRNLTISAILHDIGKIAVPEYILDKPAKLTDEEYGIIKKHPSVGAKILSDIPSYNNILPGVLYHHEHWDGSGYPNGLKGYEIPLESRIITVADVYDAITDDRPYRKGMNFTQALSFMEDQKNKLFDKEIAEIFINNSKELNKSLRIA